MTEDEVYKAFGLEMLPEHMQAGIYRWIAYGIEPGSFAQAVLENNLVEAFSRADATNTQSMRTWASWLYNRAPSNCWGSPEEMQQWAEHKGLSGLEQRYRPVSLEEALKTTVVIHDDD